MTEDARERSRKLVDRFWVEIYSTGNLDVADQLVSVHLLLSLPGRELRGPAGLKEWVATIRGRFPDIHFTTAQTLAADDGVAVRWTAAGTHAGPLLGIAPTGNKDYDDWHHYVPHRRRKDAVRVLPRCPGGV
jgi:predicted ester cyclase